MTANSAATKHELHTRLYVPSWWVHAFAFATESSANDAVDPVQQILMTKVSPALSEADLNAAAILLAEIQRQIICNDTDTIRLNPRRFNKHAPSLVRQKVFAFAKIVQTLLSTKFLTKHDDRLTPIPMFDNEEWVLCSPDEFELEFRATDLGYDLILGYTLTHMDLIRFDGREAVTQTLLAGKCPLVLWRSVWQELNPSEQLILLRLECAMQWDLEWLHFEGIFGKPIDEVFANIELPSTTRHAQFGETVHDPEMHKLNVFLDRFGRKLSDHGMIRFEVEDEYLALPDPGKAKALLCWQASSQKIRTIESEYYRHQSVRFMIRHRLTPRLNELCTSFCDSLAQHLRASVFANSVELWPILIAADTPDVYMIVPSQSHSHLIATLPLFFEWYARIQKGHRFALAKALQTAELVAIFKDLNPGNVVQRYSSFVAHICQSNSISRETLQKHTFTLSAWSHFSRRDKIVSNKAQVETLDIAERKTLPQVSKSADERVVAPVPQRDDANLGSLRKLAAEELNKIFEFAPEKYRSLKERYIAGLDPVKRQLLTELESRSKPAQFDMQIRPSLIRFMTENPAEWSGIPNKTGARIY